MIGDDFLRNAWREMCGLDPVIPKPTPSIESLKQTEWSPLFEKLMRNRMVMGAFRYGLLNDKNKPQYDRIKSARAKLDKYEKTGNLECLVDVANNCQLEFEEGIHPNRHFHAFDDVDHTEKKGAK